MIYKLYIREPNNVADAAYYTAEKGQMISFIFDPANTDYQTFKKDLANGVELQDAEGNTMTTEQINEFIKELP